MGIDKIEDGEECLISSASIHVHQQPPLLLSLNHVSFICKSVEKSVKFYQTVLGFVLIKRPSSFDFEGAWLFNHGIGIHLLQNAEIVITKEKKKKINPKDNHISFQCSDMDFIMKKLGEMGIEYATATVSEGGVVVDQLFFHDPDDYMIEICNCQNLPVLPLVSSSMPQRDVISPNHPDPPSFFQDDKRQYLETMKVIMDNLAMDMMGLSY